MTMNRVSGAMARPPFGLAMRVYRKGRFASPPLTPTLSQGRRVWLSPCPGLSGFRTPKPSTA